MKFRNAFISILSICILSLTASQIGIINAVSNANVPITAPITSPVTPTPSPITPPIPTPPSGRPSPCNNIGDINGDKIVSILDSQQLLSYLVGLKSFNSQQKIAADVNKDGKISILDVISMQQYVVGKTNTFPACAISTPTPVPAVKHVISGQVTNKILRYSKIFGKIYTYTTIVPVQNATIQAVNQNTKQIISVKTGSNGNYSIQLNKGLYAISASEAARPIFLPSSVRINLQANMSRVNFQKQTRARPDNPLSNKLSGKLASFFRIR